MIKSETIDQVAVALNAVQAELDPVAKDKINPFFKSKYAALPNVWMAVRDILTKNGLSISQIPGTDGDAIVLTTILMHNSGQYIGGDYRLTPKKLEPQEIGSAITYARRYALMAILSLPSEDDDGNSANGRGVPVGQPPGQKQPPTAAGAKPAAATGLKISAADLKIVKEMLVKGNWQPAILLARYKVTDLKNLTPDQAKEAMNSMEKGLEQKAKNAEGATA